MDLINKQDAAELVTRYCQEYYNLNPVAVIEKLMEMPSVQPEIVYCRDCKHWLHEHLCIELSKYGTIETLPNEFCGRAERRTDE